MEEYWHWLCVNLLPDPSLIGEIRRVYSSPEKLFYAKKEEVMNAFPRHQKKMDRLCKSRENWDFEREQKMLIRKGISFLSCEHPRFPRRLRQLSDCPGGLFFRGSLPAEDRLAVALVGARTCSAYGRELALWFGRELAENGVQVISGMARGVDGYAHRGALEGSGYSAAILGSGVDICYPEENRDIYMELEERGGLFSEAPPGMRALPYLFPLRNRLISGLCDAVLIIEAKENSGSLITADLALEQGKDVYAVPGRVGDALSAGCNNLIRQGAGIALSPEKLLEDLGFLKEQTSGKKEKNEISLESSEKLVYSCLSLQPRSLGELCTETGLEAAKLMTVLSKLELMGYIREIYKNFYIRCGKFLEES